MVVSSLAGEVGVDGATSEKSGVQDRRLILLFSGGGDFHPPAVFTTDEGAGCCVESRQQAVGGAPRGVVADVSGRSRPPLLLFISICYCLLSPWFRCLATVETTAANRCLGCHYKPLLLLFPADVGATGFPLFFSSFSHHRRQKSSSRHCHRMGGREVCFCDLILLMFVYCCYKPNDRVCVFFWSKTEEITTTVAATTCHHRAPHGWLCDCDYFVCVCVFWIICLKNCNSG